MNGAGWPSGEDGSERGRPASPVTRRRMQTGTSVAIGSRARAPERIQRKSQLTRLRAWFLRSAFRMAPDGRRSRRNTPGPYG